MGVRRLMQSGLARGWSAWHEQWSDYNHKKRLLQNAGARLTRPKLVHSFAHWQKDWEYEMRANAMKTHEQRLQESESSKRVVEQ